MRLRVGRLAFTFSVLAWGSLGASESTEHYQIGSQWGRNVVDLTTLDKESSIYQNSVRATAKIGSATGFFLGKLNGEFVIGTNHHVLPSKESCSWRKVSFEALGLKLPCARLVGTWPEIDFSLAVVSVADTEAAKKLENLTVNFNFSSVLKNETTLLTLGYGRAENLLKKLTVAQDEDCKVFSKDDEFALLKDPDEANPGPDSVWSFAHGCDSSHGDSGSPVFDRSTGELVGLNWTGGYPKKDEIRKSEYLKDLSKSNAGEVWTQLNYSIPIKKIGEILNDDLKSPENDRNEADRQLIQSVLDAGHFMAPAEPLMPSPGLIVGKQI